MIEYDCKVELKNIINEWVKFNNVSRVIFKNEVNSLYPTLRLTIKTKSFYSLLVDGEIRIRLSIQVGDKKEINYFRIDEVLNIDRDTKELICKGKLSNLTSIQKSFIEPSVNFGFLGDILDYEFRGESLEVSGYQKEPNFETAIVGLLDELCIPYYCLGEKLIVDTDFYSLKGISVLELNSDDMMSIGVNKRAPKSVKHIAINKKDDSVYSTASITLSIEASPQPCGMPFYSEDAAWWSSNKRDINNKLIKGKVKFAEGLIYYSPADKPPEFAKIEKGFFYRKKPDHRILERWTMDKERHLALSGHIKRIVDIFSLGDKKLPSYTVVDNIVLFSEKVDDTLHIVYETDAIELRISPREDETKDTLILTHYDQILEYQHEWIKDGTFYKDKDYIKFSLVENCGITLDELDSVVATGYMYFYHGILSYYGDTATITKLDLKPRSDGVLWIPFSGTQGGTVATARLTRPLKIELIINLPRPFHYTPNGTVSELYIGIIWVNDRWNEDIYIDNLGTHAEVRGATVDDKIHIADMRAKEGSSNFIPLE